MRYVDSLALIMIAPGRHGGPNRNRNTAVKFRSTTVRHMNNKRDRRAVGVEAALETGLMACARLSVCYPIRPVSLHMPSSSFPFARLSSGSRPRRTILVRKTNFLSSDRDRSQIRVGKVLLFRASDFFKRSQNASSRLTLLLCPLIKLIASERVTSS